MCILKNQILQGTMQHLTLIGICKPMSGSQPFPQTVLCLENTHTSLDSLEVCLLLREKALIKHRLTMYQIQVFDLGILMTKVKPIIQRRIAK